MRPLVDRTGGQLQSEIQGFVKAREQWSFVQVGSNDGVQGDPLNSFIRSSPSCRGMFVEPVRHLFDRLKQNYPSSERFIFENVAISQEHGVAEFYYVAEDAAQASGYELPFWYDQLGSFNRKHIVEQLGGILEPFIVAETITVCPLQALLNKHGIEAIDILQVDTEGHDYQVLASLDFERIKPQMIIFEHKHLSDGDLSLTLAVLEKHGYACKRIGDDTVATR